VLRVAIVDDEPLARRTLRSMLADEGGVSLVGEARSGPEAVALLDRARPDAVFLDVEMPGSSGVDVLRRAEHLPLVVFTTAYDRYAVAAFDLEAVDFLLKPFGRRRFGDAMRRLRRAAAGRRGLPADRLRRLFASVVGNVVPLAVEGIESFEGAGDYVRVRAAGSEYLVSHRLNELESKLDPERFVRIHRSRIVNLDFVRSIECEGGQLAVHMKDGTALPVSRRRGPRLRRRIAGR